MINLDIEEYEVITKRRKAKESSKKKMQYVRKFNYFQRLEYINYVVQGYQSHKAKMVKLKKEGFSDVEIVKIIGVGL